MKRENGITLVSLIVYIIVLLLAISMLSVISSHFYSNVNTIDSEGKYAAEYNKFNIFFIDDIKGAGIQINNIDSQGKRIELYNQNTKSNIVYSYSSNAIYRNDVLICNYVEQFVPIKIDDNTIQISIVIGATQEYQFTKTIKYTL